MNMEDDEYDIDNLSRFDGRRLIKDTSSIFTNEYYQQFIPDIEKILQVSKQRHLYKDPNKHLGLQYGVLQLLQTVERVSSEGNREARKKGDKELALQSRRNKYIAKAYKEIADGIAWRTLGYSRFPMRILAQGRYAGHTWGKDSGQTEELKRAANVASNGAFVLLNDITNCLRVGDLVSLPNGKDGAVHLAEIKRKELITSHSIVQKLDKKRALDVQEERLIQAQIAIDSRTMPMQGQNIKVVPIQPVLHDAMAGAGGVMKKALRDGGVAARMVTPYMRVEVLDMAQLSKLTDVDILQTKLDSLAPPNFTPIIKHSNYDRLVTTVSGELVRSAPPYTVYPLPIKIIAKLITGELYMTTTIYHEPLEMAFRALGWELLFDKQALEDYVPLTDDDYVKDFSGRTLFPHDSSLTFNNMFSLRNPKTGFTMPLGDLLVQMSAEFTTVRYITSVVSAMEVLATPERANPQLKYLDLRDNKRWN